MALPLEQIPTPKSERWKYTNLPAALKKLELQPASLGWGGDVALLNKEPPGALVYRDTQLWDLNSAQAQDIKFITQNDALEMTAQDGQWLSPRLVVHVKSGEDLTLIENQGGQGAYWKNQVVQIVLEKNARLTHYRFIDESEAGVLTSFTHVQIARDARYEALNFISGAGMVRSQIHAELQGENADCTLNGVNLLAGDQHADTTITIEHQAPHCTSNQTYKNIVTDKAHGVFQGKVHVHQAAQKTDGYQLSNTLLLSPLAEMDTKPELEIYADDVKCSHGATTGQLEENALFYLRARGIPENQARALLMKSFLMGALENIADEKITARADDVIESWLKDHV